MPPSTVKLIWSISACNFCPRTGVRTCQIKPGKLLSKLALALEVDISTLDESEGICTCCLADVDMIIRAVAIRGAMKDYYLDFIQSSRRYNNDLESSRYANGHYMDQSHIMQNNMGPSMMDLMEYESRGIDMPENIHPPPPLLIARPQPNKESIPVVPQPPPLPAQIKSQSSPEQTSETSIATPTKKVKERHTRYQCVLCDKIAGSKSHCMEHLICHSPVRPFTCSHCLKTYKSRKACREHLIVMHGVEKVEENLQKLVLVDTEGLKQLEHVCTQYRKIYCPTLKLNDDLSIPGSSVILPAPKSEPEDPKLDHDGGSAWLYSSGEQNTSRQPPPLLQCGPTCNMPVNVSVATDYEEITPPPSKRTRKGTPHKLVRGLPEVRDMQSIEPTQEDSDEGGSDRSIGLKPIQIGTKMKKTTEWFPPVLPHEQPLFSCPIPPVNPPFFPSFTATEAVFPTIAPPPTRQSPPSNTRKVVPPCERCGRCFPTKEKMADHMRSHSEVKQFSCLVCNRFFKYRRGVTNHLKEVHHFTDRNEISSKVASHEVGVVVQSKAARSRERRAQQSRFTSSTTVKHEQQDMEVHNTNISQKVIQDTLSSLADIQSAAESATMPAMESDEDESKGDREGMERSASTESKDAKAENANSPSDAASADSEGSEASTNEMFGHAGADEVFNPEEDEDDMESINLELPKEPSVPITAA